MSLKRNIPIGMLIVEKSRRPFGEGEWNVYINGEETGPFYHVSQVLEIDSISFYDDENAKGETLMCFYQGYPHGAHSITEAIKKDMEIKGYKYREIYNPPWGD